MTIALSITFFTPLILDIYVATKPECDPPPCAECIIPPAYFYTLILIGNVATALSDILAFIAVVRQVWGIWKEKRRLHLHTDKDFVTLLLQQVTELIIGYVGHHDFLLQLTKSSQFESSQISPLVASDFGAFQNAYEIPYSILYFGQVILICEFTLNLRRRNTTKSLPNQSALELELPDLNLSSQNNPIRSTQSILSRLQESIIADMGERTDEVNIGGPGEEELIPKTA
ncbi:hypothetical protein Clacol_004368 [Clathrus columnatus]|uniref:Anoctamin n=1 Tax=Clathrus columnatus TaxID=1419009 RepID=A0AAV5A6B2_9AGAM|nr:hypothetical protein Clacol_004368 [Clathrus columnatus]